MVRKLTIALIVLSFILPASISLAASPCQIKAAKIQADLDKAKKDGRTADAAKLELVLSQQKATCNDNDLLAKAKIDVEKKKLKVQEQELKLKEDKVKGDADKIAKREAKLQEARLELQIAEKELKSYQ